MLFRSVKVKVDLGGLNLGNGYGYHIHESPGGVGCGGDSTGGHYDPTDKCGEASGSACPGGKGDAIGYSASCTTSTPEGCEIGDLSGQNGVLSEGSNELSFMANIDLSGDQNVVGRSIVIHQPGGARYVCADIKYVGEVITTEMCRERLAKQDKFGSESFYMLSLGSEHIIDARLKANQARFANHSCDPNYLRVSHGVTTFGFAARSIPKGQEIGRAHV